VTAIDSQEAAEYRFGCSQYNWYAQTLALSLRQERAEGSVP